MNFPPPVVVASHQALIECLGVLGKYSRLAIDTESNSLFAYREQVCLIQVSIPDQDYIIDPLSLPNLDGFGELMCNPSIEKVFHAAEYDLMLMKREFGYEFCNLFDTMLAARTLGWKHLGLASILKKEFDVTVDKRFQRANWGKRPLTPEQISYARLDTHFLNPLRNKLVQELESSNCLIEAQESFERVAQVKPALRIFDPDGFWRLVNGHNQLTSQQLAVLRELYIFRERESQRRNRPPFKVFSNRTLVELAQALPHYLDECQGIHGLSQRVLGRYGRQLLRVIQKGLKATHPKPPQRSRPPRSVLARYEALRCWRRDCARARGVESDVIANKETLWELAYQHPKTADDLRSIKTLSNWQRERYGIALIAALQQVRKIE